ncbi:MAG: LysR family transcriptional regulator, partial [Pseudomonadales bacterium]|nr:LysR family transcriptional regulator [Pseudomonadales bacterium]
AKHVVVSSRQSGPSAEDFELSRQGYRRDVVMRCQHMYVGLRTVAQTDLLLTVPGSITELISEIPGLKSWKMPVDLPPLAIHMYWHENVDTDSANRWLRDIVLDETKSIK